MESKTGTDKLLKELTPRELSRVAVRKQLRQCVLSLGVNEPLPSVRDLMKRYRVGRSRIDSLLDEFEQEGLIQRQPRKGVFRVAANGSGVAAVFVDVIFCTLGGNVLAGEDSYSSVMLTAITQAATEHYRGVRLHQTKAFEGLGSCYELLRRSDCQACILIGQNSPDMTSLMEEYKVAWVSLFPSISTDGRRCIVDDPKMVQMQMEHLLELGHRKIGYTDPVDPGLAPIAHVYRRETYYRIMAERGLRVLPNWVQPGYDEASHRRAFEVMFSDSNWPTAVIVRDASLPILYHSLSERGLKPGRDVAIVATDDIPFVKTMTPSVTSVRNAPLEAARLAFDSLEMVLEGKEPPANQYVPLKLIVRETSCPPIA